MKTIAVIGASGRLGRKVVELLSVRDDISLIATGRAVEKLAGLKAEPRFADCTDIASLSTALRGADVVISCVHARHAAEIVQAMPDSVKTVILTGSTRRFTRFPDHAAREVIGAEQVLKQLDRESVILHPTMIYGAQGENNVQRIAALIRRFGVMPLPQGGRSLIQPICLDDVAACLVRAVDVAWGRGECIVLAGPRPVTYGDFVRQIAAAAGRRVWVLPVPLCMMKLAARLLCHIPGMPRIHADEIQRLVEDKDFSIEDMVSRLGVIPRSLEDGLRATFRG